MKTAYEILRVTDKKRKDRAKQCKLIDFKVQAREDDVGRPYAHVIGHVSCPKTSIQPWASGASHEVELHLYPPYGKQGYTWVSCNGAGHKHDFLYKWEVALTTKGSSEIRYSNGKQPNITNPAKIPGACKHVVKVLQRAVRDRGVQKVIFGLDIRGKKYRMPAYAIIYAKAVKVAKDELEKLKDKVADYTQLKKKVMRKVRQVTRNQHGVLATNKNVANYIDRQIKKIQKKREKEEIQDSVIDIVDFSTLLTEEVIIRPKDWEASNDIVDQIGRDGYLYRGMTSEEYENTVGKKKGIKSTGDFSFDFEGTSFTDDFGTAESYVNYGRDDPRKTGKSTYIVEIVKSKDIKLDRDGYYKAKKEIPFNQITRIWKMYDKDDAIVMDEIHNIIEEDIPGYEDMVIALHEKANITWYYYHANPVRLEALLDHYIEEVDSRVKQKLSEQGKGFLHYNYYNEKWFQELRNEVAKETANSLLTHLDG